MIDTSRRALRIAGVYVFLALAWIGVSDYATDRAFGGTDWLTRAQSLKGYGFVLVTGLLLYLLTRRELRALAQAYTDLAAANKELQRLSAFARLNPNPIVRLSREGLVTYANDAAVRASMAVRAGGVAALLPDDMRAIVRRCLADRQATPETQHRYEGHVMRWYFFPDPGREAVYGFGKDWSDETRMMARLIEAEKLEAVGRLTAGLAHDFNNLLMVVGLAGRIIEEDAEATEAIREHARSMRAAADQAAALVRRLLAFGRTQAAEPRPVDLNAELRAFAPLARHAARGEVRAHVLASEEPLMVLVDPGQLNQILMNLVVNAADAMDGPGRIEIGAARVPLEGREMALLHVSDTGKGIPADVLPRIFEPFFTTKADRGTGLGLAMVHDIVTQHGGRIEVESAEGEGTTFRALLPLAPPAAAQV